MSYKYGISGYRSQPVSNRSSLYLPQDYSANTFSEDLSDFDRQFKKLLERTEKFTNRVEKLQSTASYIKKGFRKLDSHVTGKVSFQAIEICSKLVMSHSKSRSSPSEVFLGKGVSKISSKFTGEYPCRSCKATY